MSAPCQPFDLILKEFGIETGAFGKYDPLPPAPHPNFSAIVKCMPKFMPKRRKMEPNLMPKWSKDFKNDVKATPR